MRFLADEDFDNDIVRGVLRWRPSIDIVRAQDVELSGKRDDELLEWAARYGRAVLSHDVSSMLKHAHDRVAVGKPMPGLFAVSHSAQIRQVIEDMVLLVECSREGEWEGQVRFLPL
ncbi:MAG: DUF5615 family PIN-like protein [Acidobacteriota bacterium]